MERETDIAIVVRDLTVRYKNGHTALHDASFSIKTGTISGLVGVNGAGKSTLFKALMGFVPIANGDISILGNSIKQALKLRLVAYVPQSEEVDWPPRDELCRLLLCRGCQQRLQCPHPPRGGGPRLRLPGGQETRQ